SVIELPDIVVHSTDSTTLKFAYNFMELGNYDFSVSNANGMSRQVSLEVVFAGSPSVTDPSVRITYPNGGQRLELNRDYTFTWVNTNFPDELSGPERNIKLYLMPFGTPPASRNALRIGIDYAAAIGFGDGVQNTGSYNFMIPSTLRTDQMYWLVVESPEFPTAIDASDEFFLILEGLPAETCSDGIQNQDETNIDCGGVCTATNGAYWYDNSCHVNAPSSGGGGSGGSGGGSGGGGSPTVTKTNLVAGVLSIFNFNDVTLKQILLVPSQRLATVRITVQSYPSQTVVPEVPCLSITSGLILDSSRCCFPLGCAVFW
ncbi:MAG: hypothetical protein HYT88_01195, partial [Candidatus Omnitrophica bacterium]|nr:hypothetical protein [Candidatus Omnitrophota bacterium]